MSRIEPDTSLGALVAERPARAALFERLRLDYCCGGAQTLAEACAERGLDPATVVEMISAVERDGLADGGLGEERDWREASIAELCGHIVSVHHARLRRDLPHLAQLLEKVVRAHGAERPEVGELQSRFARLRAELEEHIELEESTLFPACRRLEAGTGSGATLDRDVLALLRHQHAETGEALAAMRELADDYDPERALCGTHRALLGSLSDLERDIHRHVHEENNVLFPRAAALAAPRPG